MKIIYNSTATLSVSGKEYAFKGKLLSTVFGRLQTKEPYFDYIAVGSGTNEDLEPHKLGNFLAAFPLQKKDWNFNPSSNTVYSTKYLSLTSSILDGKKISEIGFCSSLAQDGEIYSYFSLKNQDYPDGILKVKGESIELEITIELSITYKSLSLLTLGENDFIKFLLGEGLTEEIFAVRGMLYLKNEPLVREPPIYSKKYPAKIKFLPQNENSLIISFDFDLEFGELREIVLLYGDRPFARLNVSEFRSPQTVSETFSPKGNYCVDLEKDVLDVLDVLNTSSNKNEQEYFVRSYASAFADKITLPFSDSITSTSPRFLSADGDKIFFVSNDNFFGYAYSMGRVIQLQIKNNRVQNIIKIVGFDKYIFVLSKTSPFVFAYVLKEGVYESVPTDFLEKYSNLSRIFSSKISDIAFFRSGLFALGFIDENRIANIMYFNFSDNLNKFLFDSAFTNQEHSFDFMLAMSYTNFSDGKLMFLKGGNLSSDCRIVTFFPDKTNTDIYSIVAYYFTKDTKQIQVKGRAVVVEKTTSPHIFVYYYPQVYRFSLELFEDELDDFFSVNMLYMAQKLPDGSFTFYNLISYDQAMPFENSLKDFVEQDKIDSIEFLDNCLLVFLKNGQGVVGISLKNDGVVIENVSSNSDKYSITYKKASLLGANNEGVKVTFNATVKL